jgi:hypothetical protein
MRKVFSGIIVLFILWMANMVSAAIITASSCSESDVKSAISAASTGDTVNVPSGSCSWSNVDITKNITLQGAGVGNTIISITAAGGIESPNSYHGAFRITGFTFRSTGNFGRDNGLAMMRIYGNQGFRVDHIQFEIYSNTNTYNQGVGINTYYDVGGLIDHNNFVDHLTQVSAGYCIKGIELEGNNVAAWSLPSQLGSDTHTVFIEDNYFRGANNCPSFNGAAVSAQTGGIFVFRHNEVRNLYNDAHGFEVIGGTKEYEFSNNSYIMESGHSLARLFYLRGGTGVLYNNTLTGSGVSNPIVLAELRATSNRGNPARPELYGGVPASSTCATTEGYPCVDQIGRGQEVGTSPNMTQTLSPLYIWGNSSNMTVSSETSSYIAQNRDYYVNAGAKPGYVAYPYPHPLQGGGGGDTSPPPPPPGNLIPNAPVINGVN